jgi:amino acid permease
MLAPLKYVQLKFADGGINASVFSVIQVTLGAGILTFPYAIMENGIVLGTILIIFGGLISWYTSMLLIKASDHCCRERMEDIALAMYGRKFAILTSILNVTALLGFNMSYIVYVRFFNLILFI